MNKIIKFVKKYKYIQNSIEVLSFLLSITSILLIQVQLFSLFIILFPENVIHNYWISQFMKFFWITITIWLALKYEKRLISHLEAAKLIDITTHNKNDEITNTYEMIIYPPIGNKELINLYINQTSKKISNLKPIFNTKLLKKNLFYLCIILVSLILYSLIIGKQNTQTLTKIFNYKRPAEHFAQKILLKPGNVTISKGSNLSIEITNPLEKANYAISYIYEELWRTEDLNESYKLFSNIEKSFSYYIKNQWSYSDTFQINVLEDPIIQKISAKFQYPAYINKKTDYIDNSNGILTIPQFTEIELTITTPKTVKDANIVFIDKSFLKMNSIGTNNWTIKFTPDKNIDYHFSLTDILDNQNQIINRSITVIPDQKPLIKFSYPGRDTLMTQNNLFEVKISASDDYGLKNLKLFYQVNNNSIVDTLILKQNNQNYLNLSHIFDFRAYNLFPGDEVTYWAEVYDNSPLNQKAETQKFKLIFPSIEDIFKEMEKQEKERADQLNKVYEDVKELKEDFNLKKRELLRKDEISWDDKKAIEKMIQDQQALNDMMENVTSSQDKMIEQMELNQAVSEQIIDKMKKIQEIMEQISNDDIKDAMKKMQQSLEQMNPDDLKQAMQNFEFKLEDFAEKLEQTLKLLQDIKNEQNMEKSIEIAKEMQKMQEELLNKTENSQNTESLSEEQQQIKEKLEALKEQMQKTKKEMQQSTDSKTLQEMQELLENLENSNLSEEMQESSEALQQNQKQKSMDKQKQSLTKMSQMLAKMEKMKSDMSGAGIEQMMENIQLSIYRLLILSKENEDKINQINNDPIPYMNQFIADFESLQLTIQQLYTSPQILLFLGQKFFNDLNFTVNSYREFFNDVQNSKLYTHKKLTSNIQAGLNLLVYDLMQALNNMQQGGQGSSSGMQSLMQSLEQMSSQQMAMNALTQSIFDQMSAQGNRPSNQMRQQLQEIAGEEQRMADNLKRMMQTNPEAQKHSNTLNQISDELEDIARKIKQNRIDKSLLDQQNRIMSRLIEVQRSINKRDRSNKRKGETAKDEIWDIPNNHNLDFKNEAERKALEEEIQKLPFEYRQIILEYLRKLNE